MSWNYRVFHRQVFDFDGEPEDEFTIRETYYDGGLINGWSQDPAPVLAQTKEELVEVLIRMANAILHPVVEINSDGNDLLKTESTTPL